MKSCDILVVGAGPAGSSAARAAASKGLDVLVVERDPTIGCPVRCAEGVDEKGLTRFLQPDPAWIAAEIDSYELVAPDGTRVAMNIEGQRGFILERTVFDRVLAERAVEKGASLWTTAEAVAMKPVADDLREVTVFRNGSGETVGARVVIAADGVDSRVARWAGIRTHTAVRDMESCAQYTLGDIDIDPRVFSLFFTGEFAPGGYAWVFPKGEHSANVGLGVSAAVAGGKRPEQCLDLFVRRYFPKAAVLGRTVGGVSCSGGIETMVANGLLVAGDAAHMANPITGGGIINAMIAGELAGTTAADAIAANDTSAEALRPYEKKCDREFGSMNRMCHAVKEGILGIPDERLNAIAHEIAPLPLEKHTPVRVLRSALFKNPKLLAILPRIVF